MYIYQTLQNGSWMQNSYYWFQHCLPGRHLRGLLRVHEDGRPRGHRAQRRWRLDGLWHHNFLSSTASTASGQASQQASKQAQQEQQGIALKNSNQSSKQARKPSNTNQDSYIYIYHVYIYSCIPVSSQIQIKIFIYASFPAAFLWHRSPFAPSAEALRPFCATTLWPRHCGFSCQLNREQPILQGTYIYNICMNLHIYIISHPMYIYIDVIHVYIYILYI